jgi:hypothetical protein
MSSAGDPDLRTSSLVLVVVIVAIVQVRRIALCDTIASSSSCMIFVVTLITVDVGCSKTAWWVQGTAAVEAELA